MKAEPLEPLLVVIPARNEADTVARVVNAVREHYEWDVLVVNDASMDLTAQQAEQAGAKVMTLAIRLGAWGATQAGIRYARVKGYRAVVTMDADGQHGADTLMEVLEPVRVGAAQVSIGSCVARASRTRRAAWRVFRGLAQLPHMDLTSGLRAYSQEAMKLLVSPAATLLDFQDVGVLVMLRRAGLEVVEVPVAMTRRASGKSRIFASWWRVAGYLLQTMVLSIAKLGFNGKSKGQRK